MFRFWGSWNFETRECIKCESDFIQLKKAKIYSVSSNYEIENRTEKTLDSFQIVLNGYKSENYIEIPQKTTRIFITDMSKIKKIDGHYDLSFKKERGQNEFMEFGYYTHGIVHQPAIFRLMNRLAGTGLVSMRSLWSVQRISKPIGSQTDRKLPRNPVQHHTIKRCVPYEVE
ncbi:MAG: hypothetical protein K9H48_16375 [Melioribacteraceae bacterium]|nr:hypothetical protein [Melioribacteraceae bacterium]MCF8394408.1 hypothetical protein [Melioribacteraceae bacterium]MCF8417496.1 hypothetical protein [Melioribacteraceae bacterium]